MNYYLIVHVNSSLINAVIVKLCHFTSAYAAGS